MIDIRKLIPTQNRLRKLVGPLTLEDIEIAVKIELIRLQDDGELYIANGHHRCVGLFKFGYTDVPDNRFNIKSFSIADMESINFRVGYTTPFNPWRECRLADLTNFRMHLSGIAEFDQKRKFIINHAESYKETRKIWKVSELCATI